jgi:flagellin
MRINYNISSLIAKNALNNNDDRLSASTLRLSSGYKINSAKDDAAGLAIARKMNMQLKSIERATRNSNDGVSVVDTADGAMSEIHSILQRMNELAVQSANGTNSDDDRAQIQLEIDQLIQEVDRISETTEFNAQSLLDGTFGYKGYTNSESVKVMSYSEDVEKGMYIIKSLTYYKYTDEVVTYDDGTSETKKYDRYSVDSAENLKNALVLTTSVSAYSDIDNVKGFPASAQVEIDDENIVISDDKGFQMKLAINDRDNVDQAGLQTDVGNTENIEVNVYTEMTAIGTDGKEYTIARFVVDDATITDDIPAGTNINNITTLPDGIGTYTTTQDVKKGDLIDNTGIVATTDIPKGTTIITDDIPAGTTIRNVYSDDMAGNYTSLEASLGISDISKVELNDKELTVTYKDSTGADVTESYHLQGSYDEHLYTSSQSTRTKYTVVGNNSTDDTIQINVTKMGPMLVQTGANEGQQLAIEIPSVSALSLGIDRLDVSTERSATNSINVVSDAINQLSAVRSKIGAYANRLEHTIANLETTDENLTSAYSRIMDVDVAEETTEYTSVQILVQAATSVLAQANERPQQVLQLLQ